MSEEITGGLAVTEEDKSPLVPYLYVNGFEVNISLSDIHLTLMTNSERRYKLLLSFTATKTLLEQLTQTIDMIEQHTKQKLLTMKEIKAGLDAALKTQEGK